MSTKDWILLFVPILCNGVVVFVLQKIFEKRQLALTEKYKYISVIQQKVDHALALFVKVVQTTGNDSEQISWLNQFGSSYCDVYYYYQQNEVLLKPLKKYMDEILKAHEEIKRIQLRADDAEHGPEVRMQMESLFRKIYTLLQSIQNDCVAHKL